MLVFNFFALRFDEIFCYPKSLENFSPFLVDIKIHVTKVADSFELPPSPPLSDNAIIRDR